MSKKYIPYSEFPHLVFVLMAFERKKSIRSSSARILAVVFLFVGIALGVIDAPEMVARSFDKIGISQTRSVLERVRAWFPYRFGLDIRGGTHLVYGADLKGIAGSDPADAMQAVRDVIERRVNLYGVAEPLVQAERSGSEWRLIVELAGITDINAAIRLIGETPFLEFREERSEEEQQAIIEAQKDGRRLAEDPYFVPTALTGSHVRKAEVDFSQNAFAPLIALELTDEGGTIFAELTKRNVGKRLAIYLDGAPISAPVVQEEITGGQAQISGDFTMDSAKEFVGRLNAGALPVPISLIGQQSIGASLGEESLDRSLTAGMYGFLAVVIFMLLWYRVPGLMAVCALLLYIAIVLFIFKLIPVTLTVAGIAGLILSVGMAVDANILIFERMKEELRQGKGLEDAIREGFARAWTSIRDSNMSSLITTSILYWFGVSMVRGFALTLTIGIVVSMFSAISVTRTLLFAMHTAGMKNRKSLFLSGIARMKL